MRAVGLLLGVLGVAVPAWADDIYRWTDSRGNIHFSNTPTAGVSAKRVPPPESTGEAAPEEPENLAEREAERLSADASLRRNALERDLRTTDKRLRELDQRLAALARARTQHAGGDAATGGVGTTAVEATSEEEKALIAEREELAQHAANVRNDAARLREEVTARFGETPSWWIDVR